MDEREKKTLEVIQAEVEENNKILRKIQRGERIRRYFSIAYWLIILGLGLGAYYVIQPYLDSIKEAYVGLSENLESLGVKLPFTGGGVEQAATSSESVSQ